MPDVTGLTRETRLDRFDRIERYFLREGRAPAEAIEIIKAAAREYGTTPVALMGPLRHKHIVRARHMAAWLLRERFGAGSVQVGMWLGGRDHTTILASWRRARALLESGDRSALWLSQAILGEAAAG